MTLERCPGSRKNDIKLEIKSKLQYWKESGKNLKGEEAIILYFIPSLAGILPLDGLMVL